MSLLLETLLTEVGQKLLERLCLKANQFLLAKKRKLGDDRDLEKADNCLRTRFCEQTPVVLPLPHPADFQLWEGRNVASSCAVVFANRQIALSPGIRRRALVSKGTSQSSSRKYGSDPGAHVTGCPLDARSRLLLPRSARDESAVPNQVIPLAQRFGAVPARVWPLLLVNDSHVPVQGTTKPERQTTARENERLFVLRGSVLHRFLLLRILDRADHSQPGNIRITSDSNSSDGNSGVERSSSGSRTSRRSGWSTR